MFNFKGKICDGIVHCIYGEDEHDKLCFERISFPKDATIKCIENRPGYDFTIMATPCDGFQDCRSGVDEQCQLNELFLAIVLLCFYVVTFLIWYHLTRQVKKNIPVMDPINEEGLCNHIEGDDLAELKVNILLNRGT